MLRACNCHFHCGVMNLRPRWRCSGRIRFDRFTKNLRPIDWSLMQHLGLSLIISTDSIYGCEERGNTCDDKCKAACVMQSKIMPSDTVQNCCFFYWRFLRLATKVRTHRNIDRMGQFHVKYLIFKVPISCLVSPFGVLFWALHLLIDVVHSLVSL